jgi:hypothetical protein
MDVLYLESIDLESQFKSMDITPIVRETIATFASHCGLVAHEELPENAAVRFSACSAVEYVNVVWEKVRSLVCKRTFCGAQGYRLAAQFAAAIVVKAWRA